jgi:DNA-binding transcriptional LysR family regulator
MDLLRLRYLLAVVDEGSVTAAARSLQVAQSGVSSQLAKLERELGLPLFRRVGRGVVLTAEGEALLPAVRTALSAVDDVAATASDVRGLLVGTLRVGTVTTLLWPRLFDAISDLHAAHPGVDLRLREGSSQELLDQVRGGELDVAIAAWSQAAPPDLHSVVVFDDALVVVVSDEHPWASRSLIRPAELATAPLIALVPGTGARDALDAAMRRVGRSVVPRWEVPTPSFVELLAQRGVGAGVVSETTASLWDLRRISLQDSQARSRLGIVWRSAPSPAARAFLERLRVHS